MMTLPAWRSSILSRNPLDNRRDRSGLGREAFFSNIFNGFHKLISRLPANFPRLKESAGDRPFGRIISPQMADISVKSFFQMFGGAPLSHPVRGSMVSPLELGVILSLVKAFRAARIAEFGVGRGANASLLLSRGPWIRKYVGIDIPKGVRTSLPWQSRETPDVAGDLVDDERFQLVIRPKGTMDLSADELGEQDFVFIDGDHGTGFVRHDTNLARAVVKCGVICWHDYGHRPKLGPSFIIDRRNRVEGNRIFRVGASSLCFEIRS